MTSHGYRQLLRGGALDSANPQTGAGHLGALLAAGLARERGLDIEQPDTIGPSIAADRGRTAALVILTVGKQTAPESRISPKVIFVGRVRAEMPH
jgi:hypothetical protein